MVVTMSLQERFKVGYVKSSSSSSQTVCRFWQQGICNRNPCRFAHGGELLPSPPPQQLSTGVRYSNVYHRVSRSVSQSNPVTGGVAPKKNEEKICRDWKSGNCSRGDDKCRFLHSWSRGEGFSMLARLEGHGNSVVCGIALPSGSDKLFTGSSDGVVHAWDCTSGMIVGTLNAGEKIGCLIAEGEWLFVGLPNMIKAWNLKTGADCSLTGPTGQVYALEVGTGFLFAGGAQDGVILAWKGSSGEQQGNPFQPAATLNGHTSAVISMKVGGGRLFSGSMDGTIKVWDISTLQCIQTIKGHDNAVMSLLCYSDFLLSCSLDQKIKVWAATGEDGSFEVVYTHEEGDGALAMCGVEDPHGKPVLLCSWNNDSVGLYELPSFAEKGRMYGKGEVRSIKGGPGGLVFTGDASGLVTVWKLAEGNGTAMAE